MKKTGIIGLIGMVLTLTMNSFAMQGPSKSKAVAPKSGRYNRILATVRATTSGAHVVPQPSKPVVKEKKVVAQDDVPEGTCVLCEESQADSSFGCGIRLHNACKSCFDKWQEKKQDCPFCVK